MKLTVLGRYGPYAPYGGACSGFLLQEDGKNILIECGNGTLSRLQKFISPGEIDAIIITHLHSDHFADLLILRYALNIELPGVKRNTPLPLYVPSSPEEELSRIPYKEIFNILPLAEGDPLHLNPFNFYFMKTLHPVPCYAIKVVSAGRQLVYSADTEYFPELVQFVQNADLFLCEANYLEKDLRQGRAHHLTAGQAGKIAKLAQAKRLLLTHLHPGRDLGNYLQEARGHFEAAEIALEEYTYVF